jgi:hypothetical protein
VIENQDRLAEIARNHFGDKIRITLPDEEAIKTEELRNEDTSRLHPPTA